jgi:heme exporter protein C
MNTPDSLSLARRQSALIESLKWLLFVGLSATIVASFLTPSPMSGSMALTSGLNENNPQDIYRIMYYHVPQAFAATIAFLTAMFYAVMYLAKRKQDYDFKSFRANEVGLIFAILALITGSLFARYTWGFWWNWDEDRMTSIFILVLMYGGYFALRSSLPDREKRATLSAVMSLLFGLAAIFLIYIVPRMGPGTLHPTETVANSGGMSNSVRIIFWPAVISFVGLFYWIWGLTVRISRIQHETETDEFENSGVTPVIEDVTSGS